MIKITTHGFVGVETLNGILRVCGYGETVEGTPQCEEFLLTRGVATALEEEAGAEELNLEDMTVAEIKNLLDGAGVTYPNKATKKELIQLFGEQETENV